MIATKLANKKKRRKFYFIIYRMFLELSTRISTNQASHLISSRLTIRESKLHTMKVFSERRIILRESKSLKMNVTRMMLSELK